MTRVIADAVQGNLRPVPGVRNVTAVALGKGGIGGFGLVGVEGNA